MMRRIFIWGVVVIMLFLTIRHLDIDAFEKSRKRLLNVTGSLFQQTVWWVENNLPFVEKAENFFRKAFERKRATSPKLQRVYLKNGVELEGKIGGAYPDRIILFQAVEGGGSIETEIKKSDIERVDFGERFRSKKSPREGRVKRMFPDFEIYRLNHYTLFTDKDSDVAITDYERILKGLVSDFMLTFLPLLDLEHPPDPACVVVFNDRDMYKNFITSRGGSEETISGVYFPKEKVLYFFNQLSSKFYESYCARNELVKYIIDQMVICLVKYYGYDKFTVDNIMGRKWLVENEMDKEEFKLRASLNALTTIVVRHEASHQLFDEWNVVSNRFDEGYWLSEGLATYCEPDEIGDLNEMRLGSLQKYIRDGSYVPISHLMVFRGSKNFHSFDVDYIDVAYTESWGFVYYLMNRHRDKFLKFIKDVRDYSGKLDEAKELKLLEDDLGLNIQELEKDFLEFVKGLPEIKAAA